jgi:phosphate transport system permease protein
MNKHELLLKRYRAEKRFQWYGRVAIIIALFSLALLLSILVIRGWQGFVHAEIRLTIFADSTVTGTDTTLWHHADVSPLIKQALTKQFPDAVTHHDMRKLVGLVSSGATIDIRKTLIAHPKLLNTSITLWLPASDAVERALKSPDVQGKLDEKQQKWLSGLRKEGNVRLTWNPYFFSTGDSREPELAGFMASIVGSLFTLISCMVLAFPIGVMAAIYLEEFAYKGWITQWLEITINNLAAVPSVVFGLLGLAVYLNLFGIPRSASLAGGLTLALMILPTIIITTRASLRAVPDSIRDAARGIGASPLQVVLHHSLPLAIPGIMTGTILGLARAMGETAPLLMIGMVAFIADIPRGIFDPATSMPVQIYLWATSPEASFVEKTAAGILVLVFMLILLNSLAIIVRKRYEHHW